MTLEEIPSFPVSKIEAIAAYAVSYVLVAVGGLLIVYSGPIMTSDKILLLAGSVVIGCGTVTGYVSGDLMNMYYPAPVDQEKKE